VYDFKDLVAIRVALKLRRAGIFGTALVPILEVLRRAGFDSVAGVHIDITPAADVVVTSNDRKSFSARRRPGQLLLDFNCDFSEAAAEVHELLRAEERKVTIKGEAPKKTASRSDEQIDAQIRNRRRRA
jgi:hypothetical protein